MTIICYGCSSIGSFLNSSINIIRGMTWCSVSEVSHPIQIFWWKKKIHFLTDVQSNSYGWFIGGYRGGGGDPLGLSLSRPWARRIRARQFQAAYGHLSVPILHFLQLLRTGGTVDSGKQLLGSSNKISKKAKIALFDESPATFR